jgi:hypothetical protein
MDEIVQDIEEILKMSPARFARTFYRANIIVISQSELKVEITSTLDYFKNNIVYNSSGLDSNLYEAYMEKWHATGLAVGVVEHYLDSKKIKYETLISKRPNNELNAEIAINV